MRLYRDEWEWSWDELNRRLVEEVAGLRSFGREGREQLPGTLEITIHVASGSVATVGQFVEDPEFTAQLRANLLNRLSRLPRHALPEIELCAAGAALDRIEIVEKAVCAPARLRLLASAGESSGWPAIDYELPSGQQQFTVGRGPWHGRDDRLHNDVQLPPEARFVSRRAAQLTRKGRFLEVVTRDQGKHLTVEWNDERIRPDRVAAAAVLVGIGGRIHLDGVVPSDRLALEVLAAADGAPEAS